MPGAFDDLKLPADRSARFYPLHPGTRRRIFPAEGAEGAEGGEGGEACWIELRGWHSAAGTEHRHKREERLRRIGRDLTPAEADGDMADMLAALTVAWRLVAPTGRALDVPCNFDTARELWADPDMLWLKGQALGFINNEGNFLPDSWKPS